MDKNTATRLIQDVFQNPFNRDRFVTFTKNLFNFLDTEKNFVYRGNFIPDAYKPYINTLERIGKYEDAEENKIDVLIVHLKKEHSIEHARTMQRNFIAWYLGGSRGGKLKDAALVAFYTDNPDDWRFSLVKMDYQIVESSTGKIKTKTELTPARRFSFLVGKNENSHTAQRQLLPTLQDDKNNPLLSDLEKAFNIEVVTQEFFEKYKSLFLDVKDSLDRLIKKDPAIAKDFTNKGVDPVDFSKKLLGQIVFLYFLQKKGWFGVGRDDDWCTGPKNFLRLLFEKMIADYKNFFNDILEPLFYEALAKERDKDFYSRFNCKIPFLNGGLFDPISDYDWVHTDILLPDDLFSNHVRTKEGDIGTGILDIFDRYNFTVKEDEPLEKEVAVDPEMLGKVFENLLEVKDRKSKGAFYTPREIVHYMCQQSLINYLETNTSISREDLEKFIQLGDFALDVIIKEQEQIKKYGRSYIEDKSTIPKSVRENHKEIDRLLKEIKVVDPAVGSGAFPVGMMNEIVKARSILSIYFKEARKDYDLKREIIENCLYGVDIESSAVEITKLRFWLSLIVDELDMKNIKPLPNLDHKIMCGNSLLEEFEGIKLFDKKLLGEIKKDNSLEIKRIEEELARLYQELGKIHTGKQKDQNGRSKEINREITKLQRQRNEIVHGQKIKEDRNQTLDEATENRIKESQKKLAEHKRLQNEFFNEQNKKKKKELKEEIDRIEWDLIEETLKEQGNEDAIKKLEQYKKNKAKPFFLWKLYFSDVFQRDNPGFDVIIANPPYVKEYVNRYAFDGLRNSPYYQGKMDLWYLFACEGIDLLRKEGLECFIAPNNWVTSYGASIMRNKVITDTKTLNLLDFGDYKIFDTAGIQTMIMLFQINKTTDNYTFDFRRIIEKNAVFSDVTDLLNHKKTKKNEFFNPLITRENYIGRALTFSNSITEKVLNKILTQSDFKLTEKEIANGIHHHHGVVNKVRKKILGDRFKIGTGIFVINHHEKNNLNLSKKEIEIIKPSYTTKEIFRYYANPNNKEWVIYTDSKFKNIQEILQYPNLKKHLDQFKEVITSDNKPYGLHRARDEYFFKGEKIIAVRKCTKPTFSYTDFDCYASATFYIIKSERISMKYLTTLLNSKLMEFWLKHKGKMQGNNYQLDKEPLLDLPIKKPSTEDQKQIVRLFEQILIRGRNNDYTNNKDIQIKIKTISKEIDQLVYKLYNLTLEEIKIVEEFNK